MNSFLKRIKIVDNLKTDLQINRSEFVHRLSSITDQGKVGIFSNAFNIFSSSKNEFIGQVNYDGFQINRRRQLFDTNINVGTASGSFYEENGHLIIDTEINGFNNLFILIYVILIIFYGILIFGVFKSNSNTDFGTFPFFFFILIHGCIIFSIPYFIMRRSVNGLKYQLEREFFYLTKESSR